MAVKSGILFLAICSQTKNEEFESYSSHYIPDSSILNKLSPDGQSLLFKKRNDARKILKESDLKVGRTFLKDLPWNETLVKGPDFSGTEKGKYLPALDLYRGGFYRSLGLDGIQSIRNSSHHVLIISGLYGLLSPDEQIQIYESPLEDFIDIQETWREKNALTMIFLDYLLLNNIKVVINVSSHLAYIHLIDWLTLSIEYFKINKQDLKVLYGSHGIMKGPEALKVLGDVLSKKLITMSEQALLSLDDEDLIGSIKLSKKRDYDREIEILSLIRGRAWQELFGLSKYETEYKEFKPTLTNFEANSKRDLEYECFEAISAFLNTNGGVLFIGVNDNGAIEGINKYYSHLSEFSTTPYSLPENQDGFRQLFDQFFSKYLGKEHFRKVILDFWPREGKDVAIVGIPQKSSTPVYIKDQETRTDRFYIRGTGSTKELEGSKLKHYIKENF
jgi:hypothetical protein